MTALEKINKRTEKLEQDLSDLEDSLDYQVSGSPTASSIASRIDQIEQELEFLEDLKSDLYSFT